MSPVDRRVDRGGMTAVPVRTHRIAGTVLLVVATLVAWWAWTVWDLHYDVDPVTGAVSGPWSPWQIAGSVMTVLLVVVVAVRRLPLWIVVPVVPLAFTTAWIATAVPNDDSGLFGVGALVVLAGTTAGTAVVAPLAALVQRRAVPVR